MDEEPEAQGVRRGHEGGLGRGEDAREHPAEEQDRRQQRQGRAPRPPRGYSDAGEGVGREAATPGEPGHHDHEGPGHEETRHDAPQEEASDGGIGDDPVEEEGHAGRDDGTYRGRRRGHGRGEVARVALVGHRLDLDGPESRRVGDGRARHAREDHAADHVDVGQPAAEPAGEAFREVVDAVGHPRRVHRDAGQHEERGGQQGERVGTGGDPLGDGQEDLAVREEERGARAPESQEDRHPEPHEGEPGDHEDGRGHAASSRGASRRVCQAVSIVWRAIRVAPTGAAR